ncbi:MAG TPA: sulfate transporter CysZ [Gammaproteobacteria bacterium]|jgi:CysZ protein|nr:sulfate transporter CysZ [Gammaproteobacteria bacterium]
MKGVYYFLNGLTLLFRPGVKRYVIVPVIVNVVLFIALFFLMKHVVGIFNAWFYDFLPAWLHWLTFILWMLFFASFFLFFVYAFVIITNVIAAPFNSFLSEKIEYHLTGRIIASRSLWENIKDVPRIIGRQLMILFYFLPFALFMLLLFFIPVVQLVAPVCWFLFHAWFMSLTYLDYPTDNHHIPLADVRKWMRQKPGLTFSFGISALLFSMIPFLNFFAIPAAVAGATELWLSEREG